MRKTLLINILFFYSIFSWSQQLPLYNQYMQNLYLLNPAVAGSDGYTTINVIAREQWIGFPDGRPRTQALNVQSRLMKSAFSVKKRKYTRGRSGNVGLGGFLFNDENNLVSKTGGLFSYAYHIRLNKAQLSLGLSGTIMSVGLDKEKLDLAGNGIDPILYADTRAFVTDANIGVFYQTTQFFGGFSVSDVLKSRARFGGAQGFTYKYDRKYNIVAGTRYEISPELSFEPSLLFQTYETFNMKTEISAKLNYDDIIWGGLSLSTTKAIIAMIGGRVDRFYFSYAFELPVNSFIKKSFGSHEIMASLKLGSNVRRTRWMIRY